MMLPIEEVTEHYKDLPYMSHDQAMWLRDVILENDYSSVCELGFYHGKSTAYFAAILKELGYGKIHTFDREINRVKPNIETVLNGVNLQDLVTITRAEKCFLWDLGKLVEKHDEPIYDFCYVDGGHDFTTTALSFMLLDKLTVPGGMFVFDDINWCAGRDLPYDYTMIYPRMSKEESTIPAVNFVCDNIVLKQGYKEVPILKYDWRVFIKQ